VISSIVGNDAFTQLNYIVWNWGNRRDILHDVLSMVTTVLFRTLGE
jgi:hypothetical protein